MDKSNGVAQDVVTSSQKSSSSQKKKHAGLLDKVSAFIVGFAIGAIITFAMVSLISSGVFTPNSEDKTTINMFDLERKIESCSDLTITKISYAGLELVDNAKMLGTPLGEVQMPFTDTTTIIAYRGTIGLGFDVSEVDLNIDEFNKSIKLTLPKIGILYNDFDNAATKSYEIKQSIFNPTNFQESNEQINRIKESENNKTLNSEDALAEARRNAETVLTQIISGWSPAEGYAVVIDWE